ncbi:disulfide bond formation protein DsbA [Niastella koreensis]|uniref:DSBA oxidoreductase n=2 Tax=Niastella koreensis TaxID=354356 RepID=G8TJ81_NIAKG|nr:thioredoxin domain-containing protein [Niastella koreensis]AEV98614.1 DSBA oxidoreductase [Niastella koreensis GR20-10]OQP52947.1 disulfide bond formation protein DsbA [Niastella koreensis]
MAKLTPPVNKNDHVQGSPDAEILLVEYGDYQCPHCGAAHPIVKEIQKRLGKNISFVFRNFPLSNLHELAIPAAKTAEAAGRQNKFWQMHDMIYEHQTQLSQFALLKFAEELKLNIIELKRDLADKSLLEKIESDFESGMRSGVNGTPSFFINGYKYNGGYDFTSLYSALEKNYISK